MKPTYGTVSRYGLIAFASSLDQIGPLTRDVADSAMVMDCIAGHDSRDSTSIRMDKLPYASQLGQDIRGIKIALPEEFFGEGLSEDVRKGIPAGRPPVSRPGGGDRPGVDAGPHPRPPRLLYHLLGRSLLQPRPFRRHPLRLPFAGL